MRIAFIGAGRVGGALATRLAAAGHDVVLAHGRSGEAPAADRDPRLRAAPVADAIDGAGAVFLAVPFGATAELLPPLAPALAGKLVVDCTNPVGPGLTHGLASQQAGSQRVQALLPGAAVVKAFSIYGFEVFADPTFPGGARPAMLFCGDDAAAKGKAAALIGACGFEPVDVGGLVQALHLEHMTLLWVRMVRGGGASPRLAWGALRG